MSEFYDRQGNAIDLLEWGTLMEDSFYKIVKQDRLGPYFVSTVWIGLDHGFGEPLPLIFETMVFKGKSERDLDCWRYATEDEALASHQRMIEKWQAGDLEVTAVSPARTDHRPDGSAPTGGS